MHEPRGFDPATPRTSFPTEVSTIELGEALLNEQLIVGFDSHDGRSRPFNLLRSQVTRYIDETGHRMLGITSATPAAGKTFVTANIAAALSQMAGRSVILCDFDLRRGSVLEAFDCEVPIGLGRYLRGEEESWTSSLYRVNQSDLYILPTVASLRGSSELLSGEPFERLVSDLRNLPENFIVLCDLPPVFANDDTMLCMRQLDGYMFVVEHGRSTAAQVKESIALLEPKPCIGTILNRYQGGFGDHYGYGYGDPYGLKNYGKKD